MVRNSSHPQKGRVILNVKRVSNWRYLRCQFLGVTLGIGNLCPLVLLSLLDQYAFSSLPSGHIFGPFVSTAILLVSFVPLTYLVRTAVASLSLQVLSFSCFCFCFVLFFCFVFSPLRLSLMNLSPHVQVSLWMAVVIDTVLGSSPEIIVCFLCLVSKRPYLSVNILTALLVTTWTLLPGLALVVSGLKRREVPLTTRPFC